MWNPLTWWYNQERQFRNVGFLAKQIFGILWHSEVTNWNRKDV
jgi:hypothetical protein